MLRLRCWVRLWLLLRHRSGLLLWLRTVIRFYTRVARSNFGFVNCALSVFGLPLFIVLLLQSWIQHHVLHHVSWKGRQYHTDR